MLSVDKGYRKRGIGAVTPLCPPYTLTYLPTASALVRHSISVMQANGAQEVSRISPNTILPVTLIPSPFVTRSRP